MTDNIDKSDTPGPPREPAEDAAARERSMRADSLLPCPFCGGEAETDSRRAYRKLRTGALGEAVAVYCRECNADMNICLADVPEVSREDLLADLVSRWNSRSHTIVRQAQEQAHAAGKAEGAAEERGRCAGRFHKDQVEVWTSEIVEHLINFNDPQDYEEVLQLRKGVEDELYKIRDIVSARSEGGGDG